MHLYIIIRNNLFAIKFIVMKLKYTKIYLFKYIMK